MSPSELHWSVSRTCDLLPAKSTVAKMTRCSWLCICDYVTWYYNTLQGDSPLLVLMKQTAMERTRGRKLVWPLTQSLHEMRALGPTTENNQVSLEADSSSAKLQVRPEPWPMPCSSRVRPWIEDWAKLIYRSCEVISVCCFKLLGLW